MTPFAALLTESAVAARWSCGKSTVRRLRAAGRLPFVQFGSVIRYRPEDIARFEQEMTVDARPIGLRRVGRNG